MESSYCFMYRVVTDSTGVASSVSASLGSGNSDRACNLGQNLGTEQCSIQLTAKCHWVDPEIFQYTFCEFINILKEN